MNTQKIDPFEIIAQYYEVGSKQWHILVEHSADVARLALEVVDEHPELSADRAFIYEAAMLHDIGIYLTDASGIECHGQEPYIRHGYLGAELLRGLGLERHAYVAERHTGSGLTMEEIRERGVNLPEGIYTPESVEEQIICYADKFYSKTKLGERKALDRVRSSMQGHGEGALARFDRMHERFALTQADL